MKTFMVELLSNVLAEIAMELLIRLAEWIGSYPWQLLLH